MSAWFELHTQWPDTRVLVHSSGAVGVVIQPDGYLVLAHDGAAQQKIERVEVVDIVLKEFGLPDGGEWRIIA